MPAARITEEEYRELCRTRGIKIPVCDVPAEVKRPKEQHEHIKLQVPFFDVIHRNLESFPILHSIYAVPNAGSRNKAYRTQMYREGLTKGIWDVCIPFARHDYSSFYIEFKYGKNTLSTEQKAFRDSFEGEHPRPLFEVHKSPETALDSVDRYLDIKLSRLIFR